MSVEYSLDLVAPTELFNPWTRASMASTQPPKLTKKQKKGIAFRERRTGKGKGKDDPSASEILSHEVPIAEDQDMAEMEDNQVEFEKVESKKGGNKDKGKGKGTGRSKGDENTEQVGVELDSKSVGKPKKRKRSEEGQADEDESAKPKQKKKKGDVDQVANSKKGQATDKQRFILFVGNLKYTTSQEAIKEHFSACDPPPTIRLLTPKPSAPGKPTAKSKGCAFLEFSHRNALQQALKLHQSEIEGRRINVELTAGGGGKSEQRLRKVQGRNKDLDDQRKKRAEKQATSGKGDKTQVPVIPERPQRFSTTSGIEQTAAGKRTWTVGDVEDGETHRGGRKHARGKKGKPKGREWGTGVNAIPVG